ncbi:MAG: serine hydrolase [Friedmanniella sp.]|nr:serine hydrolase [Friedmanniella sp.]
MPAPVAPTASTPPDSTPPDSTPAGAARPRRAPSAEGVDGAGVVAFLDAVAAAGVELHSVMLLRHGAVVAEGWWAPYGPRDVHLLYSLSKSFTSTACGLAVAEGRLSLDDTVVSFFPEHDDVAVHPRVRSLRVRHLLAMATGHTEDALERSVRLDQAEPVRGFLQVVPEQEPGSVFAYNNIATYTVGAILQRVTGQDLLGYLRPRLLDPLGIGDAYWDRYPADRDLAFSGLHLTTDSVARFGQLYLDDGVWQGERLLPEGWVAEATRLHTPNPAEENPDWSQGYGYQFWRARHGYRGDGAYGQFCVVLPDQQTVLATTSATEDMQAVLDAAWTHLLPALEGPGSPEQDRALADRLQNLGLSVPTPTDAPSGTPRADLVADGFLTATSVTPRPGGGWRLEVSSEGQDFSVACGDGEWLATSVPSAAGGQVELVAAGAWTDPQTFAAEIVFIQTPHHLRVSLDTAAGTSAAVWHTAPLGFLPLRQLATTVRRDLDAAG